MLAAPGTAHNLTTTTTVASNTVLAHPPLRLVLLTLTACGLSGEIPQWLVELPYLTTVELSGNNFNGPIPLSRQTQLSSSSRLPTIASPDHWIHCAMHAI